MDKKEFPIKNYADGWVTEKQGTEIPAFLKGAFTVIGLGCTAYFIVYMNGETSHADRGKLVQALNSATMPADGLMYVIALMAFLYVACVLLFVFGKAEKH